MNSNGNNNRDFNFKKKPTGPWGLLVTMTPTKPTTSLSDSFAIFHPRPPPAKQTVGQPSGTPTAASLSALQRWFEFYCLQILPGNRIFRNRLPQTNTHIHCDFYSVSKSSHFAAGAKGVFHDPKTRDAVPQAPRPSREIWKFTQTI